MAEDCGKHVDRMQAQCIHPRGRDSMSKVGGLGVHEVGGYSHSF